MHNRATGLGISVGAGRIGAFGAPILLSIIYQSTHHTTLALLAMMLLSLPGPLAALIWCFRGTEASNRSLEEVAREAVDVGLVAE